MALTIEQIQANITAKGDSREIINQLADYIQANQGQGGASYLVYTAIISQPGGTQNPTVVLLGSNTIGAIVWTRDSVGFYIGTLLGAFPENKTWFSVIPDSGTTSVASMLRINNDSVGIENMLSTTGDYLDGLVNKSIEIRVYP